MKRLSFTLIELFVSKTRQTVFWPLHYFNKFFFINISSKKAEALRIPLSGAFLFFNQ